MIRPASRARALVVVLLVALATGAVAAGRPPARLAGEWDAYIALSARPHTGFEGWRRMGFAHFAGSDSGNVGSLRRRTGEPMLNVTSVSANGDSVMLTQDGRMIMRAAWHGDTLTGVQFAATGRRVAAFASSAARRRSWWSRTTRCGRGAFRLAVRRHRRHARVHAHARWREARDRTSRGRWATVPSAS